MELNRRDFLSYSALITHGFLLGLPRAALGLAENTNLSVNLDLRLLPEEIGSEYLSQFPLESDGDFLRKVLGFNEQASSDQILQQLRDRMHLDYEAGQTFRFHGWILSQTEGRLCAISLLETKI